MLKFVEKSRNLAGFVFHRTSAERKMGIPLLYHRNYSEFRFSCREVRSGSAICSGRSHVMLGAQNAGA